ncbi:MAG: magnesium chelatase subunit D [Nevskia sp.]
MPTDWEATARWADAAMAAALFAVDPVGIGGVALRAAAGAPRERWLALLRDKLPSGTPLRRLPPGIGDSRLLGGLDLAATLRAGRPVAERGALAEADGGVVLLAMAERWAPAMIARITAVIDTRQLALERDGLALHSPARIGVVALDEGIDEDERPPEALLDRLALRIELDGLRLQDLEHGETGPEHEAVVAARQRLPEVGMDAKLIEAICATAMALGIASLRAVSLCLNVARAAAALAGHGAVAEDDAVLACRLVLSPRATVIPQPSEPSAEPAKSEENPPPPDFSEPPPSPDNADTSEEEPEFDPQKALEEVVLEASRAAIPPGLLERIKAQSASAPRTRMSGKAGAWQKSAARGRPAGVAVGEPRSGVRLDVIATLRAAAPWQSVRRRERTGAVAGPRRIEVCKDDFRVPRFQQRRETTTIFVVDASGSSALNRLAEAKGAVELLLADCYVRRDRVAVIAFRGRGAELLLPPTRSLVRAKRCLAGLPGGGGTPLAAGIDTAMALADSLRRRGESPTIVLLTDGSANIARDGSGGRAKAGQDATAAARALRVAEFRTLFVDTSPRAQPQAVQLAGEMNALYIALPYADAATLSSAVKAASS